MAGCQRLESSEGMGQSRTVLDNCAVRGTAGRHVMPQKSCLCTEHTGACTVNWILYYNSMAFLVNFYVDPGKIANLNNFCFVHPTKLTLHCT